MCTYPQGVRNTIRLEFPRLSNNNPRWGTAGRRILNKIHTPAVKTVYNIIVSGRQVEKEVEIDDRSAQKIVENIKYAFYTTILSFTSLPRIRRPPLAYPVLKTGTRLVFISDPRSHFKYCFFYFYEKYA